MKRALLIIGFALLSAVQGFSAQTELTWTDNSNNETGFTIERAQAGQVFAQIGTTAANVNEYTDMTVEEGKTYSYRVRAYNAAGYSAYSNTVSIAVPLPPALAKPAAPTGLKKKS